MSICFRKASLLALVALFAALLCPGQGLAADLAKALVTEPSQEWSDIPKGVSKRDANQNGRSDTDDIIAGGRLEVQRRPVYKSGYYSGGYPPASEGVCTDLVWRAMQYAGYNLKDMMDKDIRLNPAAYPRVGGKPDKNIDFRRVPNHIAFFKRFGKTLTTTITPYDKQNLALWQPGDLVTFTNPDHIAILSDKRNEKGIPYLIHNDGPWATEGDAFESWQERGITGHFRFPPD